MPEISTTEGSIRGSVVAAITPFIAIAASSIAAIAAKHLPGLELDPSQITAVMVAVVTSVVGIALKWLHGWQRHESRVADGTVQPVRRASEPPAPDAV